MSDALRELDPLQTLNPRHRQWVIHYVWHNFNASAADRAVGYADVGRQGYRLLQRPDIQAALRAYLEQQVMGAEEALTRLAGHAKGTIEDFLEFSMEPAYNPMGEPVINPHTGEQHTQPRVWIDLAKAKQAGALGLVKKVKQDADGSITVELYDAQAALTSILRAHGAFKDGLELTGAGGGPIQTAARVQVYIPDNGRGDREPE